MENGKSLNRGPGCEIGGSVRGGGVNRKRFIVVIIFFRV